MNNRLFADLSSNNISFDVAEYAKAGSVLVAIKATEGLTYDDPYHNDRCAAAHHRRLLVVHYHFAHPDVNPGGAAEAHYFFNYTRGVFGKHDIWCLDFERSTGRGVVADRQWIRDFDTRARELFRKQGVLYASTSVLEGLGAEGMVAGGRTWEARWSNEPNLKMRGSWAWARQFTNGQVGPRPQTLPGVGYVDIDRINRRTFTFILMLRAARKL